MADTIKLDSWFMDRIDISQIIKRPLGIQTVAVYIALATNSVKKKGIIPLGDNVGVSYLQRYCGLVEMDTNELAYCMKNLIDFNLIEIKNNKHLLINNAKVIFGITTEEDETQEEDWSKDRRIRFGGKYYEVRARDKDCCAICGSRSNLAVHHIIPYDFYYPIVNKMSNMITVCDKCHKTMHSNDRAISWFGYLPPQPILDKIGFDETMREFYESLYYTKYQSIETSDGIPFYEPDDFIAKGARAFNGQELRT